MTQTPTPPDNLEQRMQRVEQLSIRLVEVARVQQDSLQVFQTRMDGFEQRMEEMQSEVRGLQVTANRILERIERHFSDGHGGQNL